MGIRIIRGAICSGKSRMCLDEIEKIHNENPDARCIMIVPDHYSYETEKRFVERFGGIGLNNIEVLTLRKMAVNFLSAMQQNHLSEAGRQMLIYKAVINAREELKSTENMDMKLIFAMQRQGFLEVASSLISEMKRYLISPQMLLERAKSITGNQTLKNKLTVLGAVYEKYSQYVDASLFSDSEDDLYRLAERIESSVEFNPDTYIWIDRFDKFMPQQLCVLEALLKRDVNMTVSICCPVTENESVRNLYSQTEKTVNKIMELASVYGFDGVVSVDGALSHLGGRHDLYTLLCRWNEDFVYEDTPQNMALFQSRDAYGEVERIACKIVDLVRDEGYRFRDIAMLCGSEEEYRHLIEAVFGEYEIPYFTDRKIILSDHPIAMQILSLFGILEDDWSYDSVFRYLRAGFIYRKVKKGKYNFYNPIDQEEIDELENYVLRCGIRGGSKWLGDDRWIGENDVVTAAFGSDVEGVVNERLEQLRAEITAPVKKFREASSGRRSAVEFASALFEYLQDINLYAGLKFDIAAFKKEGRVNEAEQFTKIWNLILDVLNQTTTALGEDKMNRAEFADFMSVGLSKCEIRTIPSGLDQVYVGSVERSSHTNVKAMFVLGAKSGTFPTNINTEGFLSNYDRNTLHDEYGLTLAPDTKKKMDEQYFKVYRALCAVSEKLFLSYCVQDEAGRTQAPSHTVLEIYRKFPKMRTSDNLIHDAETDGVYISSPKATIHKMLINMSDRYEESKNPLWNMVYDWYKKNPEWKSVLSLMDRADYYDRRGIMLDKDIASMLYSGKITYSASRINTFARCPFEYFLKYGLGAYEREEWEITPANMGSYAHQVINCFCKAVENEADTPKQKIDAWRGLSDARRDEIIDGIIGETCENILSSGVRDRERTASVFARMGKTVSNAAKLVQKSLSAGSFAESGMECAFEIDITDNIAVQGMIDRIDTCEADNGHTYMRIVDYKTGRTEFDVVNIVNGYDMQMVIYALAASRIMETEGRKPDVTGIYYTAVRDKYKTLTPTLTEDNIISKNIESMSFDGVTFASEQEEERNNTLYSIDNGFFENEGSGFANVKIKKGELAGVRSLDEINGLMEQVRETLVDMDSSIRGGKIDLNPYSPNGRAACAYCSYSDVCKFDEDRRTAREPLGDKEEIWERMHTKGAAMRGVSDDAKMD